ncbi:peptidoglycan-binding protein [Streptomyces sp. CNS654]|uniref:peptidoglycan-binding protein n=1 Tax=Streptomyces sp. CNS654 TaxID=1506995 RepID=UPI00067DCBCE|nr:peptidoglycan-binding protein [Streptomyces sp. CNS654]
MSVSIISRAEWGARPWNGTPRSVPLSQRTEFFVHWFGGVPGSPTGSALAREVERLHIDGNRWAGVGYNFIVDQDGAIYEGRGWGLQGAHCPGHNISGLAVLIAVGKGGAKASAKALAAARALYDEACRRTGRSLARRGHRDGIATECPGPDLYEWVKSGMPADGYDPPTGGGGTAPSTAARYRVTIGGLPYGYGARGAHVTAVGKALVKAGHGSQYKSGPGPNWTDADTLNYAAYQRSLGYSGADADGVPGESSLRKLLGTLPGKSAPKPYAPPQFPAGLTPGRKSPSARGLQRTLKTAGYMSKGIPEADNYGPATQAAVARFHQANPAYRAKGLHYDPAIGPRGWAALHTIAYGKKK